MGKVATDLHMHLTDAVYSGKWAFGKEYGNSFVLAKQMAERALSVEGFEETLSGIINFEDNRAQLFFKYLQGLGYKTKVNDSLITIYKGWNKAHFLAGQEVRTKEGDVLILGSNKNITSKNLLDVLNEAKLINDAIVIADHPLVPVIGLSEESIKYHKNKFDAIETWNSNFGTDLSKRQIELAKKYDLPGIASSDSHSPKDAFVSYMKLEGLDFSSTNKLKGSLKDSLKNNPEQVTNSFKLHEKYRHLSKSILEVMLMKSKLLQKV